MLDRSRNSKIQFSFSATDQYQSEQSEEPDIDEQASDLYQMKKQLFKEREKRKIQKAKRKKQQAKMKQLEQDLRDGQQAAKEFQLKFSEITKASSEQQLSEIHQRQAQRHGYLSQKSNISQNNVSSRISQGQNYKSNINQNVDQQILQRNNAPSRDIRSPTQSQKTEQANNIVSHIMSDENADLETRRNASIVLQLVRSYDSLLDDRIGNPAEQNNNNNGQDPARENNNNNDRNQHQNRPPYRVLAFFRALKESLTWENIKYALKKTFEFLKKCCMVIKDTIVSFYNWILSWFNS